MTPPAPKKLRDGPGFGLRLIFRMGVTARQGFFKAFSVLKDQDAIAPPKKLP